MGYKDLKLQALAIGSLPHKNLNEAMNVVEKDFCEIPFFPQLACINKNEDMTTQFLEGLPSFSTKNVQNFCFDADNENFFGDLEGFFSDYEEIISNINSPLLEKYAISTDFSIAFPEFLKIIKKTKPQFAKGQIVGPFTLSALLKDKFDNSVIFDETLREIVVKLLILKVLWQIKHIKNANENTIPIIFMDEPTVSQIGTSAYVSITENEIVNMLKEISQIIKSNGGISAIHCCGKCDWRIPIKCDVDIINFDAYNFSQNFVLYHKEIKEFLQNGGKIAWGLVPTSDGKILNDLNVEKLAQMFEASVNNLTKSGINEKIIVDNSLITSSCGAGSLSVNDANRAMDLVYELSEYLKKRH